jgi:chemotaxis receptor (MCP) glutamine deamidase CheD
MFALGAGLDIGARNEAAVRAELQTHHVPVRGAATGGNSGRTVRVAPKEGTVNVHQAGGKPVELLGPTPRRTDGLRPGPTVAFGVAGA